MPAERVAGLDRSVRWLFDAARQALRDAGCDGPVAATTAIVIGNHSYPTSSLVDLAHSCLVEAPLGLVELPGRATATERWRWANRFSSGRPAHLLAEALGAEGPAFCLDAACASSLYALKLACDYLHDRTVDLALSGAVCGTENIFLHIGFADINALSRRGVSAPFSRHADGLVPAEGAGIVALKRLSDAVRDGDRIHGVIRGIGLSNDGARGGLLAPASQGQIDAIRSAYARSEVDPMTVSLLECHATGTPVGDATELESLAAAFNGIGDLPVGSIKSNIGHALTAAGIAAVLKVTGAMAAGIRPPTLHAAEPLDGFRTGPARLLHDGEPWTASGPRRAGINSFGFGGNNSHLILEEFGEERSLHPVSAPAPEPIAICGIGVIAGETTGFDAFCRQVHNRDSAPSTRTETVEIPFDKLRFPPNELKQSLAQQTAILAACRMAADAVAPCDPARGGVIIGMGCDVEATRCCLDIRLAKTAAAAGAPRSMIDAAPLSAAIGGLQSPGHVIGSMPNLPANRINAQLDWRGLGYTVSSEEVSGFAALEIAIRALRQGELDVALAGAVDFGDEPVTRLAYQAVLPETRHRPGDAAIAFVLKRRGDAEAAGDTILATIDITPSHRSTGKANGALSRAQDGSRFGHAHAAAAMVRTAETLAAMAHRPDGRAARNEPVSAPGGRITTVTFTGMEQTAILDDVARRPAFGLRPDAPCVFYAAAADLQGLRTALAGREPSCAGPVRIAITARDAAQMDDKIDGVLRLMDAQRPIAGPGIHYGDRPLGGTVALAYPGSAAAYAGMGKALCDAFPEIRSDLSRRHGEDVGDLLAAVGERPQDAADYAARAAATTSMALLGTGVVRQQLGLAPSAALGLSIGEANMLAAFGVWPEPRPVLDALLAAGFYDAVGGRHEAIAALWDKPGTEPVGWENHEVFAPVEQVEAVVAAIPRVWVMIVTSPRHCMIGGAAQSCAAVIGRLRPERSARSREDLAFHGPFAASVADSFHRVHRRPATPAPGMRFYHNARHEAVDPDPDATADCLRDQGMNKVDLRPTVLKAWQDGVRAFVDIGPGNGLAAAIAATLGSRPHLAVALDNPARDGLHQLADMAAALFAAGVTVDIEGLAGRLDHVRGQHAPVSPDPARRLVLPGHLPPVRTEVFESLRHRVRDHRTQAALRGPSADPSPTTEKGHAMTKPETAKQIKTSRSKARFEPIPVRAPTGPAFDRRQLETLAGGRISSIFGPLFAQQDGFTRQCRMPQPPLLLADRVLGIEGEPGSMGTGICWTETDITADSWYLHNGMMPTGLLIESGQADLLLISWLGVDFLNRDERVYRLLGCEMTFHEGDQPTVGDTIRYQIHIDSPALLGETRMFFFRYDARIDGRLVSSMRHGQAGFFSDQELANARGILWSPEDDAPLADAQCDPPPCCTQKRAFSRDDVAAFADGDAFTCFGSGFEMAAPHQRTPSIPSGKMQLIDRVEAFDPTGGPWGRGYLKAGFHVPVDAWYYDGHFKNDPCMPGTLMAEAATQALQFHMAALGFSIDRDGWVFRPVTGEPFTFICRGQVVPDRPHDVTYEVFVEEVIGGDTPTVYAALLARCDDRKVFMCRRFGIKLVRGWPLDSRAIAQAQNDAPRLVSPEGDVPGDYGALLACAWGRPSDAFGSMYAGFDGTAKVSRLPGPPYHCISRIVSVDCPPGRPTVGGRVITEFDVDPDAWYFADAGNAVMPFSVLSEILLQPPGWLAAYMGFALAGDLRFRNLDGSEAVIRREVTPDAGTLTVEVSLEKSVVSGPMNLVFFDVVCRCGDEVVLSLKTDFGSFPPEALAAQKGLPATQERLKALCEESPEGPFPLIADGPPADLQDGLPSGRLAMVDTVTGFWPEGGSKGLGRAVGRQTVDPSAWYFKAHFYEDPVQPGSLGLEALMTLLKAAVKLKGLHKAFDHPRFEAPAIGAALSWKYRGQVIPTNKMVRTEIEIVDIAPEHDAVRVTAGGSLWVDGMRIYQVDGFALRVKEAEAVRCGSEANADSDRTKADTDRNRQAGRPDRAQSTGCGPAMCLDGWTVDATVDPWLNDYCPTYAVPVYPMMALVADLVAGGAVAGHGRITGLRDVELGVWLRLDEGPLHLSSKLLTLPDGRRSRQLFKLSGGREQRVGRAIEIISEAYAPAPAQWPDATRGGTSIDPYRSGELFHFGAFQVARDLVRTDSASRFSFDAAEAIERARGHAGVLLDAVLHGIPHNRPGLWYGDTRQMAAFPYRLERLQLYADLPTDGELTVLSRAAGRPSDRTIRSQVQVMRSGVVIMDIDLVDALVPFGLYERLDPARRRSFAAEHQYHPGWSVADCTGNRTTLTTTALEQVNWLPGTLETIYGLERSDARNAAAGLTEAIATKDHFAVRHRVHPVRVDIHDGYVRLEPDAPAMPFCLRWIDGAAVEVRDGDGRRHEETRRDRKERQ